MTSNGGLSRRRVAAGGSSSTSTSDDGSSTWGSPTLNGGNGAASAPIPGSHAGSAFEGGSKIAFDPRDLERDSEDQKQGGRAPRLTIMEEVLLLGLKDKQVCLFWSKLCASYRCLVFKFQVSGTCENQMTRRVSVHIGHHANTLFYMQTFS